MLLIDDLLFAPFSGWNFIMRTLLKVAEEQWTDDAPLKEKLLHLQVELEEGSITEEQYLEAEALSCVKSARSNAARLSLPAAILTSLQAASPAPPSRKVLAPPSPGTLTRATKNKLVQSRCPGKTSASLTDNPSLGLA